MVVEKLKPELTKWDYIGLEKGAPSLIKEAKDKILNEGGVLFLSDSKIHKKVTLLTPQGELTVYGIHVDDQSEIACSQDTLTIMKEMAGKAGRVFDGAIAVVGTCFPASSVGTKVGEIWLKEIVNRPENINKIITSGVTDYSILDLNGHLRRGVNSQVAHLIDSNAEEMTPRLISLWNDGGTLWDTRGAIEYLAINGFKGQKLDVAFPKYLHNAMLVYSSGQTEEKGQALGFGRDSIEFVSKLFKVKDGQIVKNNSSIICMGGGLQSLAEVLRALNYDINCYFLDGLSCKDEVKKWQGQEVQLFSASHFFNLLKQAQLAKTASQNDLELTDLEVANLLKNHLYMDQQTLHFIATKVSGFDPTYTEFDFEKALPAYPTAHDIDSKPAQLKVVIEKLFDNKLYRRCKLDLVEASSVDELKYIYNQEHKMNLADFEESASQKLVY